MALTNADLNVSLYFDLTNGRFRIKDTTDYATASVDTDKVVGVYALTDPNSNILHQNVDFDSPDVDVDSSLFSAYNNFTEADGVYTLTYSVLQTLGSGSVSGSIEDLEFSKSFTFTYAATNTPTVVIDVESDVGLATISSTDETAFTVTKVLNTRTHTLTYPASWGSSVSTSITVDSISLTDLYTGTYVTTISSTLTITQTDNLIIDATITGTEDHSVWDTDGFYTIREALNDYYDSWQTNKTSNPKGGRNQEYIWTEICANYTLYNSYKQNGDVASAGEYLNNIKVILAAEDIDTDVDPSQSVPVTSVIPGYASQWLYDTGAPAASLGRTVDYYINTTNNQYYSKITGTWVVIGTLGANTIIQFSANGTTGWTETYANGLNYIRFSGDKELTWTVAAKFIDGYVYYAYASDSAGTDFIATDDPSFIFDIALQYIAQNKFDESHAGDLIASDFTGLFTRYKGEGIAFSVSNIEIPKDNTGVYDYTNAKAQISARRAGDDLTTSFSYVKDTESNVTATVGASTGLVSITNLAASTGYVDIVCSLAGTDDQTVRVYVNDVLSGITAFCSVPSVSIPTDKDGNNEIFPATNPQIYVTEGSADVTSLWTIAVNATTDVTAAIVNDDEINITAIADDSGDIVVRCTRSGYATIDVIVLVAKTKAGQAIVDITSVDDVTIGINGSSKAYVKAGGISETELDADVVAQLFNVTDQGNYVQLGNALDLTDGSASVTWITDRTIAFFRWFGGTDSLITYAFDGTDWAAVGNAFTFGGDVSGDIAHIDLNTIALVDNIGQTLTTYSWDGTDWSAVGNPLSIVTLGTTRTRLARMGKNKICVYDMVTIGAGDNSLTVYSFDGTDWTKTGNDLNPVGGDTSVDICGLNYSDTIVFVTDVDNKIYIYEFDGTDWTTTVNRGISAPGGSALSRFSDTDFIFLGRNTDALTTYRFDGVNINQIDGTTSLNVGSTHDICQLIDGSIAVWSNSELYLFVKLTFY